MIPFRSAFLACLLAGAAAGEAATPAATVESWIRALQGNDLATAWDALPEAQRKSWTAVIAPPAPPEGERQRGGRGNRGGGRMLDMPLRMLAEGEQVQQGGKLLAGTIAAMAGAFAAEGQPPPAQAALPAEQPFLAFIPRMASGGLLGGALNGILARGLETQQIAAIDAWGAAYAAWAATAPLADEARATAAQPHLQAFAVEVRKGGQADARAILAAWGAGLPRLKQALAVYGLDVDAALASAKVEAKPAAADGSVLVQVAFTAFGAPHSLPLKLKQADGGWELSADSPAPRWLRGLAGGPGMGRFPGGQIGLPGGGGRTPAPPMPADPPADTPKPGTVGF